MKADSEPTLPKPLLIVLYRIDEKFMPMIGYIEKSPCDEGRDFLGARIN